MPSIAAYQPSKLDHCVALSISVCVCVWIVRDVLFPKQIKHEALACTAPLGHGTYVTAVKDKMLIDWFQQGNAGKK